MPISADDTFLAELASELQTAKLDAVVVGNVASILMGAPVLTQDVDLLVRDTPLNRKKLLRFAKALGGIGPTPISEMTATERIYGARVPIDILFDRIAGRLTFASVKSRAQLAPVGHELIAVAALADVIKSKTAADRPKDRAVLPTLRSVLEARRKAGLEK